MGGEGKGAIAYEGTNAVTGLVIGSLGASRLPEVIAKTKAGYGAGRAKVMSDLIIERSN